jgi:hypothetical protein
VRIGTKSQIQKEIGNFKTFSENKKTGVWEPVYGEEVA